MALSQYTTIHMKVKLITTCSDITKTELLQQSLKKHGWDYHIITHEWNGFGDKILKTYEYLKANKDITHFFYSDAYDTIVVNTMEYALNLISDTSKLTISSERACYPHPEKAKLYPEHKSPFKYVNGGGWFSDSLTFIKLVEANLPTVDLNDQVWFTDIFLNNPNEVILDYNCDVFQTIAFCHESDFNITDIVNNTVTKSKPTFIHGNGHTPLDRFIGLTNSDPIISLNELSAYWKNEPVYHEIIHNAFCGAVNETPKLKKLRDYVEANIFGFGERSFYWLFKLLVDTQNPNFNFLEIGVFRGQTLALVRILAAKANITGITPLNSTDGHWESNYKDDIKKIHTDFKLKQPTIIKGLSTDEFVLDEVSKNEYDIIYIDGGHSYEVAKSDVYKYSSFVKIGGYLVIDDCANKYNLPEGMFKGIETVSKAVDELLPNNNYKEICSVVHIRVFKRIK